MKNLFLLLTLILFVNCTTEETKKTIDITGKWEAIEKMEIPDASYDRVWTAIDKSHRFYLYFNDSNYQRINYDSSISCNGSYDVFPVENDWFALNLLCNSVHQQNRCKFENGFLIIEGWECIEYCAYKFSKTE